MDPEPDYEHLRCVLCDFIEPNSEEGYDSLKSHYSDTHNIEAEDGLIRQCVARCAWCGIRHESVPSVLSCPCRGHTEAITVPSNHNLYAGEGHVPFAQAVLLVPPPNAVIRKWPCTAYYH